MSRLRWAFFTLSLFFASAGGSPLVCFALDDCPTLIKTLLESKDVSANIQLARKAKIDQKTISVLTVAEDGKASIDGTPVTPYKPPSTHDKGYVHQGLYSVERNGSHHIIRIDFPRGKQHGNDLKLQAMLLAQQVGGPRVYRAGKIQMPDGSIGIYFEMEEFFHGHPSSTFKGIANKYSSKFKPEALKVLAEGENRITKQVAQLYVRAFEHRLLPGRDADFIFSDGKVFWIDTTDWEYNDRPSSFDYNMGPNQIIRLLSLGDKEIAKTFRQDYVSAVNESSILSEKEKMEILRGLKLVPNEDL